MGLSVDKYRYFSHDADMRNDVKIKALRRNFSHTGYAVWCYMLESLTDADSFVLEYTDLNKELLAADFDISIEELDKIVNYCIRIGLLQAGDGTIYSERHQQRFADMAQLREKRRNAGRIGMQNRWKNTQNDNNVITVLSDVITSDNKEEENRREKIREDKKRKEIEIEKKRDRVIYPYQDIADMWNNTCSNLPRIQKLTESRKAKIKSRLDEFGKTIEDALQVYRGILDSIAQSDFLNGVNNSEWVATFDWLFDNSKNWVKVAEGNYANKRGKKSQNPTNALGEGEYITEDGRRTYGSGKANIPMSAPPRPSDNFIWDASTSKWIVL